MIDLRLVCTESGDYANPIEPSVQGGRKIVEATLAWLDDSRTAPRSSVVAR